MSELSEQEFVSQKSKLKQTLEAFPDGMGALETELESAAKHIPAYIKIVKSHVDQLQSVLQLENHNGKTLETAGLAKPVQQLIKIFGKLQDDDLQMLEELSIAAKNWQQDTSETEETDDKSNISSVDSKATTASEA